MTSRRKHMQCSSSLRYKIDIESQTLSTSHGGEANRVSTGWATFARGLYAKVEGLRGVEANRVDGQEATLTTRITIRYRNDITPAMRVKHEGRYLYPVAVYDPTGMRAKTVIDCKERPSGG